MKLFQLELITPESTIFTGDVTSVRVPVDGGSIGILANHAPLIATLDAGPMKVTLPSGEPRFYAIGGGFVEVADNVARVLADVGERVDEIDEERARLAEQRARERLKERAADLDLERAEGALERAMARLQAVALARRFSMGGARERYEAGHGAPPPP
jgi:F-type H+-transporting ATPase subunit epsilon